MQTPELKAKELVEKLMKPRYKAIADYPYSPFMIGVILHPVEPITDPLTKSLHLYPHLFRKLEWWQERQITEMPKFLKDEHGEVFRVDDYSDNSFVSLFKNNGDRDWPIGSHSLYELHPATESEYSQYIKSKQ